MPQKSLERQIGELTFESGGTSTLELPRSHYYERLNLLTDWDITVDATGDTDSETGIHELIQNIRVTLNGNQTVKSVSHGLSHFIDHYQYGTQPVEDTVDLTTASQQTGQIQTFVDFTITPGDLSAMLPSFRTSDLVLEITWGTDSDLTDGGNVTINDATTKVLTRERLRKSVASDRANEDAILDRLMAFKEREISKTLDVAGETTIDLPRGNQYYAVPFYVVDSDEASNTLVDSFKVVEDGVDVHRSVDFDVARTKDKQLYNVENRQDGFSYVAYGHRGNLSDVMPTAGMDSFELAVDTDSTAPSSPAKVRLVTQEIIN